MKKTTIRAVALCLLLVLAFALTACNTVSAEGLWQDATHRRDKEFGEGSRTIKVEVIAGEESVTFTIHTDEQFLDKALLAHSLVEGEEGAYGLYIKKVNGILADYDVNQSYWALSINGEHAMTGASDTPVVDGEHYELTYSK